MPIEAVTIRAINTHVSLYGHIYKGHDYLAHTCIGRKCKGHDYIGHNYERRNYMRRNHIRHNYIRHDYRRHNFLGPPAGDFSNLGTGTAEDSLLDDIATPPPSVLSTHHAENIQPGIPFFM